MQEELNKFYRNKVWTLVPLPYRKTAIGSKWVFRNKKDKHGITTKNKARLVAQGYSQEEEINYDETFALVARMEAIRIFLAFATYMNFKVYQMNVKSTFLNALYGLKQAPRERIDNTLFIYKSKRVVLLVQVYVDDIIFGLKSYKLCKQFEKLMTKKFKMSMIGELTYFFGLQIKQDDKGILICQEQYTRNLLKKYETSNSSSVKTLMVPTNNLGPDLAGKPVNDTSYRRIIGSLMYLIATRPDIQFSTVLYARYHSNPKETHLTVVKRILRYRKVEAEYVVAAGCCASILSMKSQLSDYDIHYKMSKGFNVSTSFACKAKEREISDCDSNLTQVIGPEVSGALSKKSKRPKSKKPPTETKVTPPKLTEGSEQSHSVSSGTVPDPQDLERNIQLTSTRLPSTLDEGTCTAKTMSRPEGSLRDKDSGGNIPPNDMEPIHLTIADLSRTGAKYQVDQTQSTRLRYWALTKNNGKPSHEEELDTQPMYLSTYVDVRALLLSDDEAQESEEDILGAGEEMDEEPQAASIAETHHQSPPPQAVKPQSSHALSTEASDTDSSCDDILKKYDNILPLTERQLVKYLRKASSALFARITEDNWEKHEEATVNYDDLKASIDDYYDENIAHRDQTDKLVEAFMSSLDKSSNTITTDPFTKFSTNITDLQYSVNTLQAHTLKQDEELAAWAKSSTNMAWYLGSRLLGLERAQNHIQSSMSDDIK
ncbi:retrovirus-related pol polyprotein from transposon TNT 1-94 [Tanacetum coccineum]